MSKESEKRDLIDRIEAFFGLIGTILGIVINVIIVENLWPVAVIVGGGVLYGIYILLDWITSGIVPPIQ